MDSATSPQPYRRVAATVSAALSCSAVLAFSLMATLPACAQMMPLRHPATMPQAKPSADVPAPSTPAATTPATVPEQTSLLLQPPTQATIEITAGSLKIDASNASLTQTLQRISDKTGMQVDGATGDERVFGAFGPGDPRDVLTNLLHGTSYNMILVGKLENGAPRQLLLSPRPAASANLGQAVVQPPPQPPADEDNAEPPQPQPEDMQPPPGGGRQQPGPGQMPARSPQELLQQLRQQGQQQNPNQPQ